MATSKNKAKPLSPKVKANRPLTRKQQAFAKYLIENPKASAKTAAKHTYNVTTDRSAEVVASELLRKPEIMAYLANHAEIARNTMLEVMGYSKDMGSEGGKEGAAYAAVAVSAAKDVMDRVHGKPKQSVEIQSTSVNIVFDLTGQLGAGEDGKAA